MCVIDHPARPACDGRAFAAAFAAALLDPSLEAPGSVAATTRESALNRYNVYRNNVTVSLINALAAIFPVTQQITGVEFFRAMARAHLRATPPTTPLLFKYGGALPDFIKEYEHTRSVPWLADVARIERAQLDAYHAADMEPLTPQSLAL